MATTDVFECFLLGATTDPKHIIERAKADCVEPQSFKYYERAFNHRALLQSDFCGCVCFVFSQHTARATKTNGPVLLRVREHSDNSL